MNHDVAVIPGDGIGPTVVDAALPIVRQVAATHGHELTTTTYDWGTGRYERDGSLMPDDGLDRLARHDSILLGAVGHPDVPDHVTLHGLLLPIRKGFNQQVCKRPSILYDGVDSPLRGYEADDIDFVVFRENTEGEYADVGGREHAGFGHEVAVQSAVFTRTGTEAVVRAAFETASRREGQLTTVTKSNAQAHSMVFWDQVVEEVSSEFADVDVERILVDAAAMDLVRRPEEFDVIVTSNLFGDILTDIGAIITGSLGLAPSGNINIDGEYPSMFEPVHGSAPDIAGEETANPLATVLSGAMLLEESGASAAATELKTAVKSQLADPDAPRTPDLGGGATTDEVVANLETHL